MGQLQTIIISEGKPNRNLPELRTVLNLLPCGRLFSWFLGRHHRHRVRVLILLVHREVRKCCCSIFKMGTEKKTKTKQKRTESRMQALQECCCSSSPSGVLAAVLTELHGTGYSSDVWGAVGAQTLGNSLSSRFFYLPAAPASCSWSHLRRKPAFFLLKRMAMPCMVTCTQSPSSTMAVGHWAGSSFGAGTRLPGH